MGQQQVLVCGMQYVATSIAFPAGAPAAYLLNLLCCAGMHATLLLLLLLLLTLLLCFCVVVLALLLLLLSPCNQ
jgi:hypothetical protein